MDGSDFFSFGKGDLKSNNGALGRQEDSSNEADEGSLDSQEHECDLIDHAPLYYLLIKYPT